jgi:hypothetical protein
MDPQSLPDRPDLSLQLPRTPTTSSSTPSTPPSRRRSPTHRRTSPTATTPPSPRPATGLDPVVAANAQAMECLRLSRDPVMPLALFLQCSAQSASMMRQSQSALRLLLGLQAARQKIEANAAALERAAWTEHWRG